MEYFEIVEKYVPQATLTAVAKGVLLAQDIKEESWKGKFYTKSDLVAAAEAVKRMNLDAFWVRVIRVWNVNMWNDVQDWAKEIVSRVKTDLEYGSRVSATKKLVRGFRVWEEVDCVIQGIYLGVRTLSNGTSTHNREEGSCYTPKEHFKCALVSPGPNQNCVYVPLTSVKEVG